MTVFAFSVRFSTSVEIVSIATGIIFGRLSVSPSARETARLAAVSATIGSSSAMPSASVPTMDNAPAARLSPFSCMPCASALMDCTPSSTRFGSSSFVSVGNADAISGAKPATSFPMPSITTPIRGRRLSATVPMLSMKLLNSISKFCVSSAMPTIRFAHAAFMLATLP